MNEPRQFNFEGHELRALTIDDEPFFVGNDAASAIGYLDTKNALKAHVKAKYKRGWRITTPSGIQEMTVISEPGLYQLASESKLPSAEQFQDWIYEEVLPMIRKHGAYMTPSAIQEAIVNPDFIIKLATQLKEEQEKTASLTAANQEMKPKALFADAVSASSTSILVGSLAKILRQNNVNIGQNRMFDWLRRHGYLSTRRGSDWNLPTQRSMDLGLFEIKESTHLNGDGVNVTTKTPKVTGRGQQYFINRFLKEKNNE